MTAVKLVPKPVTAALVLSTVGDDEAELEVGVTELFEGTLEELGSVVAEAVADAVEVVFVELDGSAKITSTVPTE